MIMAGKTFQKKALTNGGMGDIVEET